MQVNYEKIGLKSGVELHQQLDSGKLFCRCPSLLRNDEPAFTVERKLHAVAGESGGIDIAAEFESARDRQFVYQGYDTTCLVEIDESPPDLINEEALKIALQISLLLNCEILPYTQIMRKTVIDGSNTSGFQRTVIIARNGYIETASGRIGIQSVALEEDAARIISRENEQNEKEKQNRKVVYRLDRLGIPLIEIATEPDIKTPEQAKQVALAIGEILRACRVKHGIGTIRQDVNLSISGGKRIEIKGVQEPQLIQKTIETEVQRQLELVKQGTQGKNKSKAEVRKALPNGETAFLRPLPGAARMYPETDLPLLKISKQLIDEIKKTLPKLKSEIRVELKSVGLNDEMIKLILSEGKLDEFKELLMIYNHPNLVAKVLLLWPKEIASHEKISIAEVEKKLHIDILEEVLHKVKQDKLSVDNIKHVLTEIVKGKTVDEAVKAEKIGAADIEGEIVKLIKQKPGLSVKAYMGLVMQKYKGKISGKEAMQILKKYVE